MSEDQGGRGSFSLWENQSWAALSNSDNNSAAGTGSEEKSAGKNQQEQEPLQDETNKNNKRGPGGGAGKNEKGSSGEVIREVLKGAAGGGESDHEIHIWTERERRKKMRNMFSNLHALLPQLPPKADKSTIVDEAVNYIKTLQQTLQKLQKQKLERLQDSINFGYEPPMVITTQKQVFDSSREAFLADQVSSSSGLANNIGATNFSKSLSVSQFPVLFQTWTSSNVVLNICGKEAQISVCPPKKLPGLFTTICYILEKHKIEVISAHVSSDSNQSMFMIQTHASIGASNQLSEAFQVEEIFKQAAGEIMCCVSS